MIYPPPDFAHATPTALDRLQVIQNKFCRSATDAHRRKRNRSVTVSCDILCRDDSVQVLSIVHVTRRRHLRVSYGHAR
ncbi:hypothetical protein EVAR_87515_1 [Eumeta japonica]|uniref:Uncharacterized protein n=1 Tax=Eumeta variegata TaxID=151549 RepID=A0A4C1XTN1_EUMVA|nr:hypothetical protein EVAR_87515_1 [Eumeta japonica]